MGKGKITLNWNGTEEAVEESVRKYAADLALKEINQETAHLMVDATESNYVKPYQVNYLDSNRIRKTQLVFITGWSLHNLAYQIMLYSNDYRGGRLNDENDLAMLLCATVSQEQQKERELLQGFDKNDGRTKLLFLNGFWGEQSKYQIFPKHLDSFVREMYILLDIPYSNIDKSISDIIYEKMGYSWETIIKCLQMAWIVSVITPDVKDEKIAFSLGQGITYEDYCTIIDKYTTSYDEIRKYKDSLGRQILYTKPFVKTQKGETISVNVFLNMFLIDHCIYWIVRDYFKEKELCFSNEFGYAFEVYFERLLHNTLNEGEYERIPEGKKKSADWIIKIDQHQFLIEQKSAIIGLLGKQQQPSVMEIVEFYKRHLIKASEQLRQSEIDNGQEFIKIILLYEDYIAPEIIGDCINRIEEWGKEGGPYWIMTIDDMEMLLQYCSSNRTDFHDLIEKKMMLDSKNSDKDTSIEGLLNEKDIFENQYLRSEQFIKYRDFYMDRSYMIEE